MDPNIAPGDAAQAAYLKRLRASHDFRITCEVMTLDEVVTGRATFLDGQVNLLKKEDNEYVRREAMLTLSDPAGALDFTDASAWNGSSLWVDRLVRVQHHLEVPGYGTVTATPFIGQASQPSRQGGDLTVVCRDKAALATRGARPLTVNKDANAVNAIRRILTECTGEFRFRFPTSTRKLSKSYSVGLSDEASPMAVAYKIASHELGMQLLYSCDGYALLRVVPGQPVGDLGYVTDQASISADFTTLNNWVKVLGKIKSKTKGSVTTKTQPETIATVKPDSSISPHTIQRKGVDRLLPLVITEDSYTKTSQTSKRATSELKKSAGVTPDVSASVIPHFHYDSDDLVTVHPTATTTRDLRLSEGSIPLGVNGDMTIGFKRQVSAIALAKPKSRVIRKRKVRHHKRRHHR